VGKVLVRHEVLEDARLEPFDVVHAGDLGLEHLAGLLVQDRLGLILRPGTRAFSVPLPSMPL